MFIIVDLLYLCCCIGNVVVIIVFCVIVLFGLFFLGWILFILVFKGLVGINLDLFIKMMLLLMQDGGFVNVFFGSVVMCVLVIGIGILLGVLVGIWLVEYGNVCKVGIVVCFVNDILLLVLFIVLGLFVYMLYVMQIGGNFLVFVGVLLLVFIVLLVVVCIIDEMLWLVFLQMCEVVLLLGILQWKVIVQVLYCSVLVGIIIGILLVLVCIFGEIVLLLFIVFGNQYWNNNIFQLMVLVLVVMNQFVGSLYEFWQVLVWVGVLVLIVFVLLVSFVVRGILLCNCIFYD